MISRAALLLPAGRSCDNRRMSRNLIGDPTGFIALAAERGAVAQRESDAWSVVSALARAYALRLERTGDSVAAEFELSARNALHRLETNPLYAAVPPLAETSAHVHRIILDLLEAS